MHSNIEQILRPVDIASDNEAVLKTARKFAKLFNAKIFICYCLQEIQSANAEKNLKKLKELTATIFEGLDKKSSTKSKIKYDSIISVSENPEIGISNEAARLNTDLIIMKSEPQSPLNTLSGSISENVCRIAPCPVLVIRQNEKVKKPMRVRRILAPHDFSTYSELALQYSCLLAKTFKAKLYLLHIIPQPYINKHDEQWTRNLFNNLYNQTIERLQMAVSPSQILEIPKIKYFVRWGKPYPEILDFIKEKNIDLIAMGAHGSDFGLKSLFGSNVDRVIRQSPCPILVANPLKFSLKKSVNKNSSVFSYNPKPSYLINPISSAKH